MEDRTEIRPDGKARSSRRAILYGLVGSLGLASLIAARPITAAVQSGGLRRLWWQGHWGHHGGNPEAMREHVNVALKWALRDVDATAEQQERVQAIVDGALGDLVRLRERHRANHDALKAALGAASIDRSQLEETRKAEMTVIDEATRRIVQAVADAGDVLSPEQREKLLEHVHDHHER
jgi:Spy/CpxP family protein refolding chaperone